MRGRVIRVGTREGGWVLWGREGGWVQQGRCYEWTARITRLESKTSGCGNSRFRFGVTGP